MSGAVQIINDKDNITKLTESSVFGEKSLQQDNCRRESQAVCIEPSYCLSLKRFDFLDTTFFFNHN